MIGESRWRLEMRLKEHWDACKKGTTEKLAVAEHVCARYYHPIHLEETAVLDQCSRGQQLLVKEALYILMISLEECFNWDGGLTVPDCWTAVMRR